MAALTNDALSHTSKHIKRAVETKDCIVIDGWHEDVGDAMVTIRGVLYIRNRLESMLLFALQTRVSQYPLLAFRRIP
jgi:hypothetical protein